MDSAIPKASDGLIEKAYRRHRSFYDFCASSLHEAAERDGNLKVAVKFPKDFDLLSGKIVLASMGLRLNDNQDEGVSGQVMLDW